MAYNVKKADHNGPKNRGGHWGRRAEAKRGSSKLRRSDDVVHIAEFLLASSHYDAKITGRRAALDSRGVGKNLRGWRWMENGMPG